MSDDDMVFPELATNFARTCAHNFSEAFGNEYPKKY